MGFPAKLKNMNLFGDGISFIGEVNEVTVPKFAIKMEEFRGGGMLGPVMIDMGLEKLEIDFTLGGLNSTAFKQFGNTAYDGALLAFRGAYQDDSTGNTNAVELTVNGRYQEIDFGNAKAGGDTEHKYKLVCNYVQLIVDGITWAEIDVVALVYTIFGVDRYADIRAAIGA